MPELNWDGMPIHQEIKADFKTPEILIEGSLGCAKSTVFLDKEIDALFRWPGIPILLARWTEEAVATKLQKAFEEILAIREIDFDWEAKSKLYRFENGSVAHMFGLKSVSDIELFSKIRSLGVCRVAVDQAEEVKRAVAEELRARLRPDLTATIRGVRFPFQLTFVANPSEDSFWLSREFPKDNHIKGRRLFSLSVFDNPHLPQETIDGLLRTFPEQHPKHQTMVLGKRGLNVTGDPIFETLYDRDIHQRPIVMREHAELIECFHFGTHNPTWVIGQRTLHGGLMLLGGIIGRRLVLEDFLPIVRRYRSEWFPEATIQTATSPMGGTYSTAGARFTMLDILRAADITPKWRESANAPDVQLAMIEHISGLLRRRTIGREEAFGLEKNPSRWLEASIEDGITEQPFLSFALDGGYVWSDYMVSVSNKPVRQPKNDDWYFNAMRCVENMVLNFCVNKPTDAELAEREKRDRQDAANAPGVPIGEHGWMSM